MPLLLRSYWKTLLAATCLVLVVSLSSHAQDTPSLQDRLEKLEKQNDELRNLLKDRLGIDPNKSEGELLKPVSNPKPVKETLSLPVFGLDAFPGTIKNPLAMKASFKEGFWVESEDKSFTFNFGPMMQFDSGWYSIASQLQPTLDHPLLDGADLRRLRLNAYGTAYSQFEYRLEVDFSGGTDFRTLTADPQAPLFITDAWLAMKDIPFLGTVRIGHQKEYLTFSNGTSDRYHPFMERPLIFDAFEDGNQFDDGITINNSYLDKKLHTWLGLFRTGTRTGAFGVGGGRMAFDQRISYFPVLELEDKKWWILQAHGTVRDLPTSSVIAADGTPFRVPNVTLFNRPLVRAGGGFQVPRIISTPTIFSSSGEAAFGLGTHGAIGPFTVGAEYLGNTIRDAYINTLPGYVSTNGKAAQSLGNIYNDGFYVESLCFITPGDHRSVLPENPGFSKIRPVRPFQFRRSEDGEITRGPGAWEVKFRYDHSNLENSIFAQPFIKPFRTGGSLDAFTFGLNWYWNANMSMMADYVYTLRTLGDPSGSGNFSSFGIRTQFEF
ncbi:MAG: hypothetical protein RIR17_1456 [Planctomycetota bacterium]